MRVTFAVHVGHALDKLLEPLEGLFFLEPICDTFLEVVLLAELDEHEETVRTVLVTAIELNDVFVFQLAHDADFPLCEMLPFPQIIFLDIFDGNIFLTVDIPPLEDFSIRASSQQMHPVNLKLFVDFDHVGVDGGSFLE